MTGLNHARSACLRAGAFAFCASLAFGSAFAGTGQAKVTLKFNFKNGQKMNYDSTMSMTSSGMGGPGAGMNMKTTMKQAIVITSASAKSFTAKTTVSDTKMTSNNPQLQNAIGKDDRKSQSFTATYDLTGKLLSGAAGNASMGQLGASSGFMGANYPTTPVGVGSTWSVKLDLSKAGANSPMTANMKTTGDIPVKYTLKSFGTRNGKRTAVIGMVMKGTANITMGGRPSGGNSRNAGQNMTMIMVMDGTGTVIVDVATGLVYESTLNASTTVTMQGMSFGQKINAKSILK